jgi:uncharacterized protein (DUF1501 family)
MAIHETCDGMRRRDMLKVGAFGAGLTLAQYLKLAEAGEVKNESPAKAGIFIHLAGGPSHMDTFDLKPDAPDEYRGQFSPIDTNVAGIQISEHLPKLAQCADKYAILRGVSHTLAAHRLGSEYVNTGTRPIASLEYPGYGAVVSREMGSEKDLPGFVSIPRNQHQKPGYLGVKYAALDTGATPRAGSPFSVRGISMGNGVTISEVERRKSLLQDLDVAFQGYEEDDQLLEGLDKFSQQAHAMITSRRSREAFDISKESPAFAGKFGETPFGQSCLLASRLVEAGVKFVTISFGGWDTHQDNFTRLKERQLPPLDEGLSGLFGGLAEKGLLDTTSVFVTGEFGRTPKINTRSAEGGRDHYPRCMFMLMGGGGMRGGQVVGKSDDKAVGPADRVITPDNAAATFYQSLGIDYRMEYQSSIGRPITIVRDGSAISELIG